MHLHIWLWNYGDPSLIMEIHNSGVMSPYCAVPTCPSKRHLLHFKAPAGLRVISCRFPIHASMHTRSLTRTKSSVTNLARCIAEYDHKMTLPPGFPFPERGSGERENGGACFQSIDNQADLKRPQEQNTDFEWSRHRRVYKIKNIH